MPTGFPPGVLLSSVNRGKKYLVFLPGSPSDSLVQDLGFRPVSAGSRTDFSSAAYWKEYHPSLITQVLNLLPETEISADLQELLDEGKRANAIIPAHPETVKNDLNLKSYQVEAVNFLSTRRRAMLALAPGLGKTLCALRAAEAAGYARILVTAPLSLLDNWQKEIRRWLPNSHVGILRSHNTAILPVRGAQRIIYITSYEGFLRYYEKLTQRHPLDLVIFDESVLLKNRETQRFSGSPARQGKQGHRIPEIKGVKSLLKDYSGAIWELSGGPTTKNLSDLWAQLHLLDGRRFKSFWQFAGHYCILQEDQWGTHIIANKPGAEELLEKDIADIYLSRSQDQVENLPSFLFEELDIEMSDEQAAVYSQMEKEFFALLPDGDEVIAANVLTQLLRLVQIASNPELMSKKELIPWSEASAKWRALENALEYVAGPVLVWTNFVRTAESLGRHLAKSRRVAVLTGAVTPEDRQAIVDNFQGDNLDVLIAHPGVGKFGHTLTHARTAIYVERSYAGDDYYQSLYRVRRIGTEHRPHVLFLLSRHNGKRTVDHAIHDILKRRHENNIDLITSHTLRAAFGEGA